MKLSKRLMALALTGAMALGVSAGAVSFPDVDETTPEGEAIIKLAEMGVLGGFEDGTFRPEATVTRAQFAKIIYLLQNPGTEDIPVRSSGSRRPPRDNKDWDPWDLPDKR